MAATFTGESNIFELDEFTINVIVQRCWIKTKTNYEHHIDILILKNLSEEV